MPQGPNYTHDCDGCHQLGTFTSNELVDGIAKLWDLWVCVRLDAPEQTTIICRFSSEPSDYSSSCVGVLGHSSHSAGHPMMVGWQRAVDKRLALSKERLKELREDLIISQSGIDASRLTESVMTLLVSVGMMEPRSIRAAKRHIDIFVRGDEDYETEFLEAVKKYLDKAYEAEKKHSGD